MTRIRPHIMRLLAVILVMAATARLEAYPLPAIPQRDKSAVTVAPGAPESPADTTAHKPKGFFNKVIAYFDDTNKPHSDKRFDISVLGGPHYASDTKFGLGLVAAGLYSTDRADSTLQLSNVSLYGDVSSVGYYMVGVGGTAVMPHDRMRLIYDLYVSSWATKFWGIGYDMASCDANAVKYTKFQSNLSLALLVNLGGSVYLGPEIDVNYVNATGMVSRELWQGERLQVLDPGLGATLHYDTRDNRTAPQRGWFVEFAQRVYPRWLGNRRGMASTEASGCFYQRMWRGSVLATRLHSRWAYGKVPWTMLSELGDEYSMRGYYRGRYVDRFEADLTVELRQHIWRRNGVVAWVGVGTVAPSPGRVQMRHLLPNFGVGYRWEFKKFTNVRLDYGFGRHTSGFLFSINEAF